jgi:hypothetical protein
MQPTAQAVGYRIPRWSSPGRGGRKLATAKDTNVAPFRSLSYNLTSLASAI